MRLFLSSDSLLEIAPMDALYIINSYKKYVRDSSMQRFERWKTKKQDLVCRLDLLTPNA